jgi:L-fuculose-phosphate aldolase
VPVADATAEGLVAMGRRVVAAGLVVASGGNLAARLPERNGILVTPRGWALDDLNPAALATVELDGRHIRGAFAPTTELALHLAALGSRPDAVVSLHLHPPMASLLHAAGVPIRRITTDHAYYLRQLGAVPFIQPGSDQLARAVAAELVHADIVLLENHGCVIVADCFDVAFSRAVNLEAAAVATYRAHLLNAAVAECPPDFLAEVRAQESAGVVYGKSSSGAPIAGQTDGG